MQWPWVRTKKLRRQFVTVLFVGIGVGFAISSMMYWALSPQAGDATVSIACSPTSNP